MPSMSWLLRDVNRALLNHIRVTRPVSMSELADLIGLRINHAEPEQKVDCDLTDDLKVMPWTQAIGSPWAKKEPTEGLIGGGAKGAQLASILRPLSSCTGLALSLKGNLFNCPLEMSLLVLRMKKFTPSVQGGVVRDPS